MLVEILIAIGVIAFTGSIIALGLWMRTVHLRLGIQEKQLDYHREWLFDVTDKFHRISTRISKQEPYQQEEDHA